MQTFFNLVQEYLRIMLDKRAKVSGIYKITSPTGRVYIGQSINIYERWRKYKKLRCKAQPKLYASLTKYGVKAHKFEIIHKASHLNYNIEALNYLEFQIIENLKATSVELLNLKDGGDKAKYSQESREAMRAAQLGKKGTPESNLRKSLALKGRKKTAEHIAKVAEANRGRIFTEQIRANMSQGRKKSLLVRGENSGTSKLTEQDVLMIRKMAAEGGRFWGRNELMKKLGVSKDTMTRVVNRETWTHI